MNPFSRLFRSRDKPAIGRPQNRVGGWFEFLFGNTSSGKPVNERTAMETTAVYACVRILAETIASLPLHTYKYTKNGREKATEHNLYHLLHDEPNPEMTSFTFRETLMSHLLLWGNAYAQIIRDGNGRVLALYPLLPDKMTVSRAGAHARSGGVKNGDIYYEYRLDADENSRNFRNAAGSVILSRDDVLHVPGLGFDGLIGYSPVAMAKNAVGMVIATEQYGASFFANGANPGGVLEHPGVVKDPLKLRESWNAQFQGSPNAHRVAVLEEGLKFNPVGIPPEQAQFLETRKFQTEEICRIFRVPPHLIASLDKATFSNIESQSISFVVHTIRPWLVRWEQTMNKTLLLPGERNRYFTGFNVDGLLRGNYENRMRGYSIGIQNGFMSVNDVRTLEQMDLVPDEEGGNLYFVNGNMVKLKDVGAAYNTRQSEGGEAGA